MRICRSLLLISILLLACTGCSGGGNSVGSTSTATQANPYAGTYVTTYSKSSGTITIAVDSDGSARITVADDQSGVFTGTGTCGTDGKLRITATKEGTQDNVVVDWQFSSQGSSIGGSGAMTGTGSVSTALTTSISNPTQITSSGSNAFAGSYSGTYSGSETGTWTATINSDGSVTATATGPSGATRISGKVSTTGYAELTGNGSGSGINHTMTWTGTWWVAGGKQACQGKWTSSSGYNGAWSGTGSASSQYPTPTPPNNPPSIQPLATQQWTIYQKANDLQVTITDADNDSITSRVEGLPEGMTYSSSSKSVIGTPTKIGAGTASVHASDGKSETIGTFQWSVTEPPYKVLINKLSVRDPVLGIMTQGDYEIPVRTWLKLINGVYTPSKGLREINELETQAFQTLWYTNYPALTDAEKDQVTWNDTLGFAPYADKNQANGEVFKIIFDVSDKTLRAYRILESLERR